MCWFVHMGWMSLEGFITKDELPCCSLFLYSLRVYVCFMSPFPTRRIPGHNLFRNYCMFWISIPQSLGENDISHESYWICSKCKSASTCPFPGKSIPTPLEVNCILLSPAYTLSLRCWANLNPVMAFDQRGLSWILLIHRSYRRHRRTGPSRKPGQGINQIRRKKWKEHLEEKRESPERLREVCILLLRLGAWKHNVGHERWNIQCLHSLWTHSWIMTIFWYYTAFISCETMDLLLEDSGILCFPHNGKHEVLPQYFSGFPVQISKSSLIKKYLLD